MILKIVICAVAVIVLALIINTAEDIEEVNKKRMSFKEALDLAEVPVVTFLNNGDYS